MEGYFLSARHIVKYPDCNATDNLFGGQLLAWVDEGAGIFAGQIMLTSRIVTRYFGGLPFDLPVERGKIVSIYCAEVERGHTSFKIHVVATKKGFGSAEEVQVADTEIVFVAIDKEGRPIPWKKDG